MKVFIANFLHNFQQGHCTNLHQRQTIVGIGVGPAAVVYDILPLALNNSLLHTQLKFLVCSHILRPVVIFQSKL